MPDAAPLIVSALFAPEDFHWLDGLRRAHFPPERNQLDAHLTLFHHLLPSLQREIQGRLSAATRRQPSPPARVAGILNLGRGVALRIDAPALAAIRGEVADALRGTLTPQDAQGWRAHVTIQNKVAPEEARRLRERLEAEFRPRPVTISGLALWRYRGGPWELVSRHSFGG